MPSSDRAGVVVNPTKVKDLDALKERVDTAFTAAGKPAPEWRETTAEDPGRSMTEELIEAGRSPVLAAGGDGTVRVVCAAAANSGTPVALLPLGTGNLLARNLDLPLDLDAAVAAAVDGADKETDLGCVEGDGLPADRFAVMAGLGFDAAVMSDAPEGLKARIGSLAYVVSGLRHLRDQAVQVEITVDGETFRRKARTVLIGNVGSLQAGVELAPDADPHDGILDVVVIGPRTVLQWLRVALRVARKSAYTDHLLDRRQGCDVRVRSAVEAPRQLDGDPVAPGRELHATADAGSVLIRRPADDPEPPDGIEPSQRSPFGRLILGDPETLTRKAGR